MVRSFSTGGGHLPGDTLVEAKAEKMPGVAVLTYKNAPGSHPLSQELNFQGAPDHEGEDHGRPEGQRRQVMKRYFSVTPPAGFLILLLN